MKEKQKEKEENILIQKIKNSGVNLAMPEIDDEDGKRNILKSIESAHPSGSQVKTFLKYFLEFRLIGNFVEKSLIGN